MKNVIEKYAGLPFRYGRDCCQFAGECVESITGKNPMDNFSYVDEKTAHEAINAHGNLEGAMRHTLGEPYDGHKDGDVCLISANRGGYAAAVVFNGRVVARVESGLMDYPISRAILVWPTHV